MKNESGKQLRSKETYFASLAEMIRGNYLSIKNHPDKLSPFVNLERLGQVFRFPGGAALTLAESSEENPKKIELITDEIKNGNTIHLRAHAQIEPAAVEYLYRVKGKDVGEDIQINQEELMNLVRLAHIEGTRDSSTSAFEYMGAYHCGGLQGLGPIGGVAGAIKQSEELIEKLSKEINKDLLMQLIKNGQMSIGIELPGNLTIYLSPENIDKDTKNREYTIGLDKEKINTLEGYDKKSKWLVCVDERVAGGETTDFGPGSVFPHATVVIGIADTDDSESRDFAASLDSLRLINPQGAVEPTSAGLRYIMPGIKKLSGVQSDQFASSIADLWELLCTEMLTHSGTSGGNWSVGLKDKSERLSIYRPNFWAQMQRFLDFHHGTIAVASLEGVISLEMKHHFNKLKIPVIEIPRIN